MSLETNVETARPIQQIVGRMTVSELGDSIRTVLETGRLGSEPAAYSFDDRSRDRGCCIAIGRAGLARPPA